MFISEHESATCMFDYVICHFKSSYLLTFRKKAYLLTYLYVKAKNSLISRLKYAIKGQFHQRGLTVIIVHLGT